jgi:hypothetical protein
MPVSASREPSSVSLITKPAAETMVDSWGMCDDWGEDGDSVQVSDARGQVQDDSLLHSIGSLTVGDNRGSGNVAQSGSSERYRSESASSSIDSSQQDMDSETAECAECTPEDLPDAGVDVNNVASLLMSYTAAGATELASGVTTFDQYYINVIDEPYNFSGHSDSANSHEMELLADYAKRENVSLQELLLGYNKHASYEFNVTIIMSE